MEGRMTDFKCPYRTDTKCKLPSKEDETAIVCKLCLLGQICDEVGLNTSAIMNMSMDKTMEAVHKEEYE